MEPKVADGIVFVRRLATRQDVVVCGTRERETEANFYDQGFELSLID